MNDYLRMSNRALAVVALESEDWMKALHLLDQDDRHDLATAFTESIMLSDMFLHTGARLRAKWGLPPREQVRT